jgi:hypothetical protein
LEDSLRRLQSEMAEKDQIMIAMNRVKERPYPEVAKGMLSTHAIIADKVNFGAGVKIPLESCLISEKIYDEELRAACTEKEGRLFYETVARVVLDGCVHQTRHVLPATFYDEITDLTQFSRLRYFREVDVVRGKGVFALKKGQLVELKEHDELVQVIALCLAPPPILGGDSMLLVVWADPNLEYVSIPKYQNVLLIVKHHE